MTISDDTRHVLDHLESVSTEGLRKRNDLGVLFELAAEGDDAGRMNDLFFHGSHLYRLYTTLRRGASGAMEGREGVEKEFHGAAERLRELIAPLLVDADPEQVERFESTYYTMTQGSLRNLVDLAHDLNVAKGVQNEEKRK